MYRYHINLGSVAHVAAKLFKKKFFCILISACVRDPKRPSQTRELTHIFEN